MKYVEEYDEIMKRRNFNGNVPFFFVKKKKLNLQEQSKYFIGAKLGLKFRKKISDKTERSSDLADTLS